MSLLVLKDGLVRVFYFAGQKGLSAWNKVHVFWVWNICYPRLPKLLMKWGEQCDWDLFTSTSVPFMMTQALCDDALTGNPRQQCLERNWTPKRPGTGSNIFVVNLIYQPHEIPFIFSDSCLWNMAEGIYGTWSWLCLFRTELNLHKHTSNSWDQLPRMINIATMFQQQA